MDTIDRDLLRLEALIFAFRSGIQAYPDLSGAAPKDCAFYAIADNYDGAEDSRTRYDVGYGATPEDAVLDLRRLLAEYLDAMDPRLDEDREPDPRDDP